MASVATNVTAFDVCVTQTAEMYTFTALVTESTLVVRYDVFLCNGTLAHSLEKAMLQLSRAFFKCIMMEVTRMSCDSRRQKWILSVSYCVGPQNNRFTVKTDLLDTISSLCVATFHVRFLSEVTMCEDCFCKERVCFCDEIIQWTTLTNCSHLEMFECVTVFFNGCYCWL